MLCNLKALHAGVVPDSSQSPVNLTYHGIIADVDADFGRDSRSGKNLPIWASWLSSSSKQNILKHRRFGKKDGLDIEDYIEEVHVNTIRFSDLISQQQGKTIFLMIDTEGLDYDIVLALSSSKVMELPPFSKSLKIIPILYEQNDACGRKESELA